MNYAGDISPEDAWERLISTDDTVLVDVRTRAEWSWVGLPDLTPAAKQLITIEWNDWPNGTLNGGFLEELEAAGVTPHQPVLFLCRSGVRSQHAAVAATAAGYVAAYNVAGGFEGSIDGDGHRGVGGWKAAGLPWRQT